MARYTPSEAVRNELKKEWQNEHMYQYCLKKLSNEMQLDKGGFILFEKPKIETRFCFGYSDSRYNTEDYDRANQAAEDVRKDETYFLNANRKEFNSILSALNKGNRVLFYHTYNNDINLFNWCYDTPSAKEWYSNLELYPCSDAELERLKRVYEEELTKFNKRLTAYLNRYGLSKIHSWSYWRDE